MRVIVGFLTERERKKERASCLSLHPYIQLSRKGCCEKRGECNHFGAREISATLQWIHSSLSLTTKFFFLQPFGFLLSRGTLDRSGRLPASQSGVRISLRGSNESTEGLLDGSSSDNSQARRGCRLYTECETNRRRN